MAKPHLDIELYQGDFKDLAQRAEAKIRVSLKAPDADQDYSLEAIKRAFSDIGEEPPQDIIRAHELLNKHVRAFRTRGGDTSLFTGLDRSDLMSEMLAMGERLSIIYAEWESITNQLELLFWPSKETDGAKYTTDAARKRACDAKLAPYKAIQDIIYYLFIHCAKYGPSVHQTILHLEREMLKNPSAQ